MKLTGKLFKKLSIIEKLVARSVTQTRRDFIDSEILADLPRLKNSYLNSMDKHIKEERQHSGVLNALSCEELEGSNYEPAKLPNMAEASGGRIGYVSRIPLQWRFCVMAALEKEAEHFYRALSCSTTGYPFKALTRIADQESEHSQYLRSMHRYLYPRTWWVTWRMARLVSFIGVAVLQQRPWR